MLNELSKLVAYHFSGALGTITQARKQVMMKKVYLVGFRGTGFADKRFRDEPALIRAGHVGFYFEDDRDLIFGFHPTEEAVRSVGDDEAVIEWLKAKQVLDGSLQDDYAIFARADELAQGEHGARTMVWEFAVELSDEAFERIRQQVKLWYDEQKVFTYAFPSEPIKANQDNCATFPRRLGLPVLDSIGQIKDYVRVLQRIGQVWKPKGA